MKTEAELKAMTKAELDAYGNEHFGIDLDSRRTKRDLIACLLKAQEERASASAEGDTAPEESQAPAGETEQAPAPEAAADPAADPDGNPQPNPAPDPEPEPEPDAAPVAEPVADGDVRITVTAYSSSSGVPLFVNGRSFTLPIGQTVTVPGYILPSLEAVADVVFTKE